MPAEWERHERTLMAWPTRANLWLDLLDAARRDYAAIARTIADFEPVTMVVDPSDAPAATAMCGPNVEVLVLPIDDSWVRDSGPIGLLRRRDGARAAVDFRFDSWGEKFLPYADDAALGSRLLAELSLTGFVAPIVLEGGSISVDGAGRGLSTAQCLLEAGRNPGFDRVAIERILADQLGISSLIWLPRGLVEDRDTDGHVDNVAAFAPDDRVVVQGTRDPDSPNAELLAENRRILEDAGLDVLVVEHLPYATLAGRRVVVPPLNFYVGNGAVFVPVTGSDPGADRTALDVIGTAFADREIVGVPGAVLAFGGGGVHCITQQVPAAPARPGP